MKKLMMLSICLGLVFSFLTGCEKKKDLSDTMEEAGQKVEDAADKAMGK